MEGGFSVGDSVQSTPRRYEVQTVFVGEEEAVPATGDEGDAGRDEVGAQDDDDDEGRTRRKRSEKVQGRKLRSREVVLFLFFFVYVSFFFFLLYAFFVIVL